jgi:hypothetical protein
MFGAPDFEEREVCVTDGTHDAGIDGYYIDTESKIIVIIQSKFRTKEGNFEAKPITAEEILSMDIRRVLGGEEKDRDGCPYNGKIIGMQRRIADIPDLGRYQYKVVILANCRVISEDTLRRLSDGFNTDVFNFERSYVELLYPVLAGTLFKAAGLSISLDLSNKTAGAKIRYLVTAGDYNCDLTVVFVPTLEIARVMSRYKNSILKFNPRSYLEFEGDQVNSAIRATLISSDTNEFALLNNGVTIVCDESGVNEQSGRMFAAKLFLLNPQIINGGQTAYTLSRIYESLSESERERMFSGKEVLVRAIALSKRSDAIDSEEDRAALIERISLATNRQTAVTQTDRSSGDPTLSRVQTVLFERFGLLYERKRGEFSEGLRLGYISDKEVINRTLFARIFLTANGRLSQALRRRVLRDPLHLKPEMEGEQFDKFFLAWCAYKFITKERPVSAKRSFLEILPQVYASCLVAALLDGDAVNRGPTAAEKVQGKWPAFLHFAIANKARYVREVVESRTGNIRIELVENRAYYSDFIMNADRFFTTLP